MNNTLIYILLIVVASVFVLWYVRKHFKRIKLPSVYLISGAVKSGKSNLSVALAVKQYKKNLRKYKIAKVLSVLLPKKFFKHLEKPMLYSNINLRYVKYNLLNIEQILRLKRFPYGSVVLIDEASLLADSMLFNVPYINESLMLFFKLFAHETMGGTCVINTQSYSDLHFAIKRCVGQYLYIHSSQKFPFVTIFRVREMVSSDDGTMAMNTFENDMELSLTKVFVLNKYRKYYDRYCYSVFTDDLPILVDYDKEINTKNDSIKTAVLVTLQDFKSLGQYQCEINDKVKGYMKKRSSKK